MTMIPRANYFRPRRAQIAGATRRLHVPVSDRSVLRLRATAEVAPYFLCQRYHPSQRIVAEHPDGSLELTLNVEQHEAVADWLRLWSQRLTVVEPRPHKSAAQPGRSLVPAG